MSSDTLRLGGDCISSIDCTRATVFIRESSNASDTFLLTGCSTSLLFLILVDGHFISCLAGNIYLLPQSFSLPSQFFTVATLG